MLFKLLLPARDAQVALTSIFITRAIGLGNKGCFIAQSRNQLALTNRTHERKFSPIPAFRHRTLLFLFSPLFSARNIYRRMEIAIREDLSTEPRQRNGGDARKAWEILSVGAGWKKLESNASRDISHYLRDMGFDAGRMITAHIAVKCAQNVACRIDRINHSIVNNLVQPPSEIS